jgi:hypothetical protein|tara:strand:+ start:299 stop:964 length:666 start_codon:yes stop_codon:yes gene_type:complete
MLTVWREPQDNHIYCIGVDTSEGLIHGDYSCVQVLDVRSGEQVAIWHGHIPPDTLANEVYNLALWYKDALTCVESNNHGLTTIVQLRHLGHPNLFRKRSLNQATTKVSQEFGWKTTRTTKPLLIDDLGMALRSEELIIHDRFTLAELRTYVRNERGSMSGSPHDDRVMALALANEMRQYAFMPEFVKRVDDYWTVDWFARLVKPEETADMHIGKHSMRGTL